MTTSSTASALILAIILLLVASLSPGNCASTGEGNALFFSFGGSGKNRSFATEFAFYGDAEMNISEVRVTRAANESFGLMIYWKPVRFFDTKPGFSSSFSFSVSPGNGGGLAFFLSPVSVPLEPANGDWSRLSTSVVIVKFMTAASLVEVDVGRELLTKSSNLSDDGLLLILSRGEKLHSWIDYDGESKRIEVRLCQDKDPKEAAPSISHSIDLSYMLWREASWASLTNDATVSVNRCLWSPEGSILGVAFSKHLVQIYAFNLNEELRQHLEIDAHIGSVNDIAFSYPKKTLSIITCGDDKAIKVWDASTGQKQYTFEGHEAPVYSVCRHFNGSIHFFFSTSIDGKIKAWSYEGLRSRVAYEAPGHWCTTMAYSADGTRIFSCGTSKDGDSHLVEWNETGTIKQAYNGFRKQSLGVVQFDTTRNCFLVAGDEFQIKFWDMDNTDILTTTDANGGLPVAFPQLRFQKDGSLLVVMTSDNGIKILANADGQRVLRMLEVSRSVSKQSNSNVMAVVDSTRVADVKPRIPEETERIRSWKLTEIVNVGHLKTLRLPDSTSAVSKVVRLIYTNSGCSLLALGSNAVHKLWQWPCDERNPSGKSTTSVAPQLRQPPNGILMTNERSDNNPEEATACIALSKNDSYATSASCGKVSLLNMRTFKVITTFMPTPPAATSLAFHPEDNNMIAAGMEDSSILIYNIRIDEVHNLVLSICQTMSILDAFYSENQTQGPPKKDNRLAFSPSLNVLVSAGADAQMLRLWKFPMQRLSDILKVNGCIQELQLNSSGKITLLDIGNNEIGPKGAFSIAEFVKKTKSLLRLNLYMNDIGDAFTNLKYSRVEIDEVRFEWAEYMLDYI
ncbi:hypothetical protein ZIOFF_070023 [Zingiber officinale]|uniref:Legume lectin domain-containing protein n=1 Tax=Zingiber officinale TaxID=94328 RepID=A0A8J5CCH7_ZINOF|nr:hypothetical protein ZIOFF_070023 [Zingiber officinale]